MDKETLYPFNTIRNDFGEDLNEEETHALLDQMYAEVEKYEQRVKDWLDQHDQT